ncbi:diaminopropionate ammonia-lyase [Brenneria goodwinii]|uniref:diaminopropionate ammonia-lyase n=1 Tax=Brenneria goodwinii TaxID=1109412 RepID=UPI000EF24160|nr:diaminopropionate ammonia-lyase [Brenneria goodwinii]MCG8158072.1 diaminopropionate ammonia-lyase [Brenneria goodwinii]MCG8162413.1 diaminopropionate ammonia-lyase [Brenneria goodwinii]MCG8167123.1 diaminopropionate ammonia-lyase [Brenneria goodwinii]MCG8171783.1 diaminopropionate ammonia-lyase [Brenneria goodwinii]MCG8176585.1 diaminopropionate ammonia-lyase [Brenneria goodwinii]
MTKLMQYFINDTDFSRHPTASTADFRRDALEEARQFHRTIPGYQETPLVELTRLADYLGLGSIFVKDESWRFGLNAFKALGASFAMAKYVAGALGQPLSTLPFPVMIGDEVKRRLPPVTFATTTDGNHGRGVAWMARQLGQKAVIYMPRGSSRQRLEAIRREGAEASIVDMNYDEAVRMTAQRAAEDGWVVLQDTAWPGYEDVPRWIMQGYGTLLLEACDRLQRNMPTHVLVQAGVGAFAGMVQGVFTEIWGEKAPRVIVVESDQADCLHRSAKRQSGDAVTVGGKLQTIMAGLACGEANQLGWGMLRDYSHSFLACPDYVAAHGMRLLGHPLAGDKPIISGESGAVTAGALALIMRSPDLAELREQLGLNDRARVLLISTEGDTDPAHYLDVVWGGKEPSFALMPHA